MTPGDAGARRVARPGQGGQPDEDPAEQQAGQRAGAGDPRLGGRARRFAAQFGDPAEQPQGDALHRNPVTAGHQRVRQFVGQQRGQVHGGGQDSGQHVGQRGLVRVDRREVPGGQAERDQSENDRSAPVHPDRDAADGAQRQGCPEGIFPLPGLAVRSCHRCRRPNACALPRVTLLPRSSAVQRAKVLHVRAGRHEIRPGPPEGWCARARTANATSNDFGKA